MTNEEIFAFSKTIPYSCSVIKSLHDYLTPDHRNIDSMKKIVNQAQAAHVSVFDVAYDLKMYKNA